jgi:hypothetical protein
MMQMSRDTPDMQTRPPERAADLRDSVERAELAPIAIHAFVRLVERRNLSESHIRALLGDIGEMAVFLGKERPLLGPLPNVCGNMIFLTGFARYTKQPCCF